MAARSLLWRCGYPRAGAWHGASLTASGPRCSLPACLGSPSSPRRALGSPGPLNDCLPVQTRWATGPRLAARLRCPLNRGSSMANSPFRTRAPLVRRCSCTARCSSYGTGAPMSSPSLRPNLFCLQAVCQERALPSLRIPFLTVLTPGSSLAAICCHRGALVSPRA